jgi:murein DD-endopeptidase MepM/ murein hydrolase activator NlpD
VRTRSSFPVRYRRDGSVYFHQAHPIRSAFGEAVAMILFVVIGILILGLAIFRSAAAVVQQPDGLRAIELHRDKDNHGELKEVAGNHVDTEPPAAPSVWPLQGRLTDGFGVRRSPFRSRSSEFHPGQDIAAPKGTPVSVTADGTVIFAGCKKGYGEVVIVDHGNNISTRYGHLSLIQTTVGRTIRRGDQIGLVGSTGRSTGSHLHYEVRVGQQPVNPMSYLGY